jgi:hypothetical protein
LFTFAPFESKLIQWAVPVGRKEREWTLPNGTVSVQALAVSPDGRYIGLGQGDGRILILRLASGKKPGQVP